MDEDGGQEQQETNDNESQNEFPNPFDPCGVRDFGHTEDGNEHAAGGREHVGETVAELESQDGSLAADADEVGELCHDGHGEGRLGGAGRHDQIQQCLEDIHDADRSHIAAFGQGARQGIEECVDNLAIAKDKDDAAGQSHHKGCGKDVFATGQKELGNTVGTLLVGHTAADAHGKEERGNLLDIPTVAQHADDEEADGEEKNVENEEVDGLAEGDNAGDEEEACKDGHEGQRGLSPTHGHGGGGHGEGAIGHDHREQTEENPGNTGRGVGYRILLLLLGALTPIVVNLVSG